MSLNTDNSSLSESNASSLEGNFKDFKVTATTNSGYIGTQFLSIVGTLAGVALGACIVVIVKDN
ncbi:hypothetical protein G7B40_033700 [Aetokthonos hydrillicola Thurmond2011]|jgi:hypothetical protein|uniref:Uncharacterized protein n=1 Tax=Aetokthonos hydrillicola Thurmond2011 TaxID=2712845 RepID=A0AAP5MCR1_9CYAN|nr:hypothetical protein [Aetokthonos hydrillicola]MBO3459705.1 hypothetical protein [Aetokthonos hydrillicola CCALA 1050]MBW4588555.1 hypothetical protein [Aetokthonos hydrillicola CCALA 1050]MDR9899477.1 hypothetical protein [Aetokthonos hydrillicola Thurmond2011]